MRPVTPSPAKGALATAAESLVGAFTWRSNQVAPRMLGFKVRVVCDAVFS